MHMSMKTQLKSEELSLVSLGCRTCSEVRRDRLEQLSLVTVIITNSYCRLEPRDPLVSERETPGRQYSLGYRILLGKGGGEQREKEAQCGLMGRERAKEWEREDEKERKQAVFYLLKGQAQHMCTETTQQAKVLPAYWACTCRGDTLCLVSKGQARYARMPTVTIDPDCHGTYLGAESLGIGWELSREETREKRNREKSVKVEKGQSQQISRSKLPSISFKIKRKYVYDCLACMCMDIWLPYACSTCRSQKRILDLLDPSDCELQCEFWELNLGGLPEQQVLLTMKPSLHLTL